MTCGTISQCGALFSLEDLLSCGTDGDIIVVSLPVLGEKNSRQFWCRLSSNGDGTSCSYQLFDTIL